MRLVAISLTVVVIAAPSTIHAQDCTEAVPLRPGEAASCVGVLFPPQWALRAVECHTVDLPACLNDSELVKTACQIDLDASAEKLQACSLALLDKDRLLDEALNIAPAWWESPGILAGLGFVAGVGTTIAIIFAVQ